MSILSGLRVCFVAGTLGQGGAERQLFYQLQTLKKGGAQPMVFCFTEGGYWQQSIEALGVPVIGLDSTSSRPRRISKMLSVLRGIAPDILQSAHFYANMYVALVAHLLHSQEIGAVRSDGIRDVADAGMIGGQLHLRVPRLLAVNSKKAIQEIKRMGLPSSKLFYLPNVVDTQRFSSNSRLVSNNTLHILMVGRLVALKRFDSFLRALYLISKQSSLKVVGHIVGDGPDKQRLEALAYKLGLNTRQIYFHGAITDVEQFYRQVDLCLHISDWEGLPNTILEAMSCGLPIIASPVGGIPEIVQHVQTGLVLKSNDENEIAAAIAQLIEQPDLRKRMSQKARDFVERNYALSHLSSNLESLYERALNV